MCFQKLNQCSCPGGGLAPVGARSCLVPSRFALACSDPLRQVLACSDPIRQVLAWSDPIRQVLACSFFGIPCSSRHICHASASVQRTQCDNIVYKGQRRNLHELMTHVRPHPCPPTLTHTRPRTRTNTNMHKYMAVSILFSGQNRGISGYHGTISNGIS